MQVGKPRLNRALCYWMAVKSKCHTALWKLLLWNSFCQHSLTDLNGNPRLKNSKLIVAADTREWTVIWFLSIFRSGPRGTLGSGWRHPAAQGPWGIGRQWRGKSPHLPIAAWSCECFVGAVKPHWAHIRVVKMMGGGIKQHYPHNDSSAFLPIHRHIYLGVHNQSRPAIVLNSLSSTAVKNNGQTGNNMLDRHVINNVEHGEWSPSYTPRPGGQHRTTICMNVTVCFTGCYGCNVLMRWLNQSIKDLSSQHLQRCQSAPAPVSDSSWCAQDKVCRSAAAGCW